MTLTTQESKERSKNKDPGYRRWHSRVPPVAFQGTAGGTQLTYASQKMGLHTMTTFRLCPHVSRDCRCSDVEMQPCLAALDEAYLEELRDQVRGVDPDGGLVLSFRHRDIRHLLRTFDSFEQLKAWYESGRD
jgi:hypothetical protein